MTVEHETPIEQEIAHQIVTKFVEGLEDSERAQAIKSLVDIPIGTYDPEYPYIIAQRFFWNYYHRAPHELNEDNLDEFNLLLRKKLDIEVPTDSNLSVNETVKSVGELIIQRARLI